MNASDVGVEVVEDMNAGRLPDSRDGSISNFNDMMLRISEDTCHDCVGSWRSHEWLLMDNGWKGNIYTTETKEFQVYSM